MTSTGSHGHRQSDHISGGIYMSVRVALKKSLRLFVLTGTASYLVACNNGGGGSGGGAASPAPAQDSAPQPNNNSGGVSASNDQRSAPEYLTYEMKLQNCTTGLVQIGADTEVNLKTAFCARLKDEAANQNCALQERFNIYQESECPEAWQINPESQSNGFNYKSNGYQIGELNCKTGYHYRLDHNGMGGEHSICGVLRDDGINRNCAKEKRNEYLNKACK